MQFIKPLLSFNIRHISSHVEAEIMILTELEHHWFPWKFVDVPSEIWTNNSVQRQFFDWVGHRLGFSQAIHCNRH